jgi:CheY-like chemotaxis protein
MKYQAAMPDDPRPIRTVLLVEDDPNDAEFIKRAFKITLFARKLIHIVSGEEALAYLFADPTPMPEIVILDLNLPGMSGIAVLRRMRQDPRTSRIPTVVISSILSDEVKSKILEFGAHFFLRKHVDTDQFNAEVLQLELHWLSLGGPQAAIE